jgi:hypothetical protein
VTAEVREEIAQRKRERQARQRFENDLRDAVDELGTLVRCANRVLAGIKTEADLDRLGDLYHALPIWEHQFEMLVQGNIDDKTEVIRGMAWLNQHKQKSY